MNSISGKVKRTEPGVVPSTQLSTEGGDQVRLTRKGKGRSWKLANVIPKYFNITFIGNGVEVRHKYCWYNLRKISLQAEAGLRDGYWEEHKHANGSFAIRNFWTCKPGGRNAQGSIPQTTMSTGSPVSSLGKSSLNLIINLCHKATSP